jgi:NAD(P)-dependent dehydrogenase (short-subunit alcohol dehydrogenase family)
MRSSLKSQERAKGLADLAMPLERELLRSLIQHTNPLNRSFFMSKIAIVTGSSRGLGRNTALSIARRGGDVIVTYKSRADEADRLVAEIAALGRKAVAFQLDTSDVPSFKPFADRVRTVLNETWKRDTFDHLVNNAGHGDMAAIADATEEHFDSLFNVHFKGVYFLTQALLPLIADGGRIVNLSSGLTRVSYPGFSAYAAAKGAVEILSVYLAKELGSRGIAVNTVAPGAIETDFLGGAVRDTPDMNKAFADMIALGRVGVPDDIGPMIASLLSEDNRWVTGQRIEVSGGQVI